MRRAVALLAVALTAFACVVGCGSPGTSAAAVSVTLTRPIQEPARQPTETSSVGTSSKPPCHNPEQHGSWPVATSFNPATCSIQEPTEQAVETSSSAEAPLHAEPACHLQKPAKPSGTGFLNNMDLNAIASAVGSQFVPAVQAEPNYAGAEIVNTGFMLSIVGSVTPAETTAITSAEKLARRQLAALSPTTPPPPFSVTIRKVCYTLTELSNIDGSASEDPILAANGITVSAGGPNIGTNSVDEWLDPYNAKVAEALRAKYGTVVHIPPRTIAVSAS